MQGRYYLDVNICPMDRWEKAHQSKYSSIRIYNKEWWQIWRTEKYFNKRFTVEEDYDAWNELFKTFVDKIGLEIEFKEYIDNMYALQKAQLEYIMSANKRGELEFRDRKILNKIKRLKIDIKSFEQTGTSDNKMSISRVMGMLGKMQGYKIKKEETTVLEYFELIKDFKQWQKEE